MQGNRWGIAVSYLAIVGAGVFSAETASAQATSDTAADAPSPQSSSELADIIVTAQKRSQSLRDVAETINVAGAQELSQRGVVSASDLTKIVPGFSVSQGYYGAPIYTLRGVSFNALNFGAAPTVSVYVDEAPVPFTAMAQGAVLDLERVEVLKGPQGTLFGQNATGGAINYIAAKPTDTFEAGIRATYGRFDTLQSDGYVSGPLGGNVKARLAVSGTTSGPWQRNIINGDELGRQRKLTGRLLLDWSPSDDLKLALNVNGWLDRSDTTAPQLSGRRYNNPAEVFPAVYDQPLAAGDARDATWDPVNNFRRNNNFRQVVLRADYKIFGGATLTSITDYAKVNLDSVTDLDGMILTLGTQRTSGYIRSINQELRLSGDTGDARIHYILGASFQKDRTLENEGLYAPLVSSTRNVAGIGSFDSITSHALQNNRTWAVFGNADWKATDDLTISAGLRQTWVKHHSTGCTLDGGDGQAAAVLSVVSSFLRSTFLGIPVTAPIPAGGCVTLGPDFASYTQNANFKEDSLSWRLSATFKASDDINLYGAVSRGFKGGNYPVPSASSYTQLAPVTQEKLTAYEAGIKARFLDRRLSVNAAAFYYQYKDKQLETTYVDPIFGPLIRVANIPNSRVYGFDADVVLNPVTGLTFRAAATYASSKVGSYADGSPFTGFDVFGAPAQLTGNPFNLAPEWIVVSDAEYRRPVSSKLEAFAGASLTYNSSTYADLADSPSLALRAFNTVDLRAGVGSMDGRWQAMAFVRNVGDKYYWTYAASGADSILRMPAMPRTYGLTLSFKY